MAQHKEERLTLKTLQKRIDELEAKIDKKPAKSSINRVEIYNGEEEFVPREESKFKMDAKDKLISIKNAIQILPPNLKVDGRHTKENIQAICGFLVDEEMLDSVYEG